MHKRTHLLLLPRKVCVHRRQRRMQSSLFHIGSINCFQYEMENFGSSSKQTRQAAGAAFCGLCQQPTASSIYSRKCKILFSATTSISSAVALTYKLYINEYTCVWMFIRQNVCQTTESWGQWKTTPDPWSMGNTHHCFTSAHAMLNSRTISSSYTVETVECLNRLQHEGFKCCDRWSEVTSRP